MTRFSFHGQAVDEDDAKALPDHLVVRDNREGVLVVRRRTQRYVPVPPAIPRQREASEK